MTLQDLGLTVNEEKVYLSFIGHGQMSARQVSAESQVPYGRIYVVLESLKRKGLVRIVPEKTKKYILADPEELLKLVKTKENSLKKLKKQIYQWKQEYKKAKDNPIEIVHGTKAFNKLVKSCEKPKTFYYTVRYVSHYTPLLVKTVKECLKKEIPVKSLVRVTKETKRELAKWEKTPHPTKAFKNKGVAINISDEQAWIILFESTTTILVKDKAFVDVLKRMFEATYEAQRQTIM